VRLSQIVAACRRAGITSYEHVSPKGETLRLTFGPLPEQPLAPPPATERAEPERKRVRPKGYDLLLKDEAQQ